MRLKYAPLLPAVALSLVVAGCSPDDSGTDSRTDQSVSTPTAPASDEGDGTGEAEVKKPAREAGDRSTTEAAQRCPTAPSDATTPSWTLAGVTGSLAVTAATDTTAPSIEVSTPFSVATTAVETIVAGTGATVTDTDVVSVCYEGVNGTTARVFDSAYQRGEPASFSPGGVIPGFREALVGQRAGARVAVAIPPVDGYGASGNPGAAIGGTDTIVFEIHIVGVTPG